MSRQNTYNETIAGTISGPSEISRSAPSVSVVKSNFQEATPEDLIAKDFLEVIHTSLKELMSQSMIKTYLCEVVDQVDINHYDLYVLPDRSTVLHNIINNTRFDFKKGDYVEILDAHNNLSTAYIANGRNVPTVYNPLPYNNNSNWRTGANADRGCFLQYYKDTGKWRLYFTHAFYNKYLLPQFKRVNGDSPYGKIRIGIARVLSQKSSVGNRVVPASRRWYSLPDTIGYYRNVDGYEWVDDIRVAQNYTLDQVDCSEDLGLMFSEDVTDIVNNSIFLDDYLYRRSKKYIFQGEDFISHMVGELGYWFKRFGIYILSEDGKVIYVTPSSETCQVRIHKNCSSRQYNLGNMTVSGRTINLDGDLTTNIYQPNEDYIIHRGNYLQFMTSNNEPVVTDDGDPFVTPGAPN